MKTSVLGVLDEIGSFGSQIVLGTQVVHQKELKRGKASLVIKAFEWTTEISHGYTITSSTFWSFYYTAAGLHGLHVIAGAIIMLIVAETAKKNLELHRVELIGIYWHFVDIVWIFLFPLLYIAK
ncbi:MAG: cytochrome c oxidase subunit 3 [Myxococcales bacterium]|nr:cytochrome c oxidase subunit 3 [Myxococcales bacterium]